MCICWICSHVSTIAEVTWSNRRTVLNLPNLISCKQQSHANIIAISSQNLQHIPVYNTR
jgi:hypothetical protein